ncbi:MAG TPA: histidine phosphatase family protein [Tepidisphaeraceae bacterium]|jgi:broad specificity phosphatase PhoE
MRKLILVKHARPQMTEGIPSHAWGLSDEGRAACGPLAAAIRPHDPVAIVTSEEPKAHETARLIADALGKPIDTAAGLQEHDRSNVPIMRPGEFLSALALFFKAQNRLVLGKETAYEAAERFQRAVESVLKEYPDGNVAIVTHGTVLALFASENGAGDPFQLYRQFGLPSFLVFSVPDYKLLEKREKIVA